MKYYRITFYALLFSLTITSIFTGYYYRKTIEKIEIEQVIDWNTKQIHSLSINSSVEKQNAELLIQILNVLDDRKVKIPLKKIPLEVIEIDNPVEDDDVPHTFEQVNKDQKEVDMGIRAAANNNLFQAETLHNILNRVIELKKGN